METPSHTGGVSDEYRKRQNERHEKEKKHLVSTKQSHSKSESGDCFPTILSQLIQ